MVLKGSSPGQGSKQAQCQKRITAFLQLKKRTFYEGMDCIRWPPCNGETTSPDVRMLNVFLSRVWRWSLHTPLEAGAASGNKRTGGVLGTVYFRNFNLDLTAGDKFVSARAGTSVDLPWGLSFHTTMCDGAFQVARRVSDHTFDRFSALNLSAIGLQRLPVDES